MYNGYSKKTKICEHVSIRYRIGDKKETYEDNNNTVSSRARRRMIRLTKRYNPGKNEKRSGLESPEGRSLNGH